ncbi:ribonuclease H-like domain-containing protein, partial [Tanacetum coccineum]
MAVHILSLLPTTILSYRAPFEVLYGFFPTYTHLRVFRCLGYPNLSATSKHKLAPRSTACVYLGPSSDHRGSRCLDLITQRVIISCHVTFDEDHLPYSFFTPLHPSADHGISRGSGLVTPNDVSNQTPRCESQFVDPSISHSSGNTTPNSHISTRDTRQIEPISPLLFEPSIVPPSLSNHPMVTRSQTGSLRPVDRLNLTATTTISPIPRSTAQAMCDPNWKRAMDSEMSALLSNNTWTLVPCPSHSNIVGCCWLYRHKFDSHGNLERYKGSFGSSRLLEDDIILTASSVGLVHRVISRLSTKFAMTDLGELSYFISVAATRSSFGLFLSRSSFARDILERANMRKCNSCTTPADTKSKLSSLGTPVSNPTLYRSLAGALQYLTIM